MGEFKDFLSEMTMNYGQNIYLVLQDFSNAQYVGDVEKSKVLYKKINGLDHYGITESDNPDKVVSYVQVQDLNILGKDYLQLRNVFTEPEFRGQNYAKKLMFFLRNIEKKSFVFGDVQSELGRALVKSIAKSKRFPMFWFNTKTGEKHEYNAEKDVPSIIPYRSWGEPTGWVIMTEGLRGELFTTRFLVESDPNYWHKYIQWFD